MSESAEWGVFINAYICVACRAMDPHMTAGLPNIQMIGTYQIQASLTHQRYAYFARRSPNLMFLQVMRFVIFKAELIANLVRCITLDLFTNFSTQQSQCLFSVSSSILSEP